MSAAYSYVGDAGFELLIEARGRVSSRQRFGVESREASFGGKGLWQGAPVDDEGTLVYSGVRSAFRGDLHIRFTGKNDATVATLTAGAVGRHAGRRSVVLRAAGILDRPASVPGVPVWLEIEVQGLRYGYRVFGLGPASLKTGADGELAGPGRKASGTTSGSIGATPEAIDATGDESDGDPAPALALFGDGGLRIVRHGNDNDDGREEGDDRAAKVRAVRAAIDGNYRDYFSWLVRCLSTFDRSDAEDAAQEALVWVWSHADTFDESRGSLKTYLRIRAHSIALRAIASRGPRAWTPDVPDQSDPDSDPQARWARFPRSFELLTAARIAHGTFVWKKELGGCGPDQVRLWSEAAWMALLNHPGAAEFLVRNGLSKTLLAARAMKCRIRKELCRNIEDLGFRTIKAGARRPLGDMIYEVLDQFNRVKFQICHGATCDLEELGGLLGQGIRLVIVRPDEALPSYLSPFAVIERNRTCLVIDANRRAVGTLQAEIVDEEGSGKGFVVSPAPRAL